jgi:multidrug efflux pump subunit AcrA (membrane-fusion protein)
MFKFIVNIFKSVIAFAVRKKILAAVIGLLIVIGGYFGIKALVGTSSATKYVLATVEKGSLITSISGSGQVSVSQQVDVKPKVSGDVVWVGVTTGQEIYKGQALFSIDSADAQRNVNDAEISLNEARMQLAEDIAQAPIDYADKVKSLEDAKDNLKNEYEDVYVTISDVFINLPTVMTGARNILYNTNLSGNSSQQNLNVYKGMFSGVDGETMGKLVDAAEKDYIAAKTAYDKTFTTTKIVSRYSEEQILEDLLDESLETVKLISQLIKDESNIIDTIVDLSDKKGTTVSSSITTFQTNLRTYSSTINNAVTSVASQVSALDNAKDSVVNLEQSLKIFLINNLTGDNPLSLQKTKNSLAKQEETLQDLKDTLADYTIRSTIAGTVASIDVKVGDSVSSATAAVTVISKQYTAELSLNEVDATNVKVGQKATITFDAVEDLTISGEVTEVDTVGAVSSGVVTYNVVVAFDMQDEKVKVGMSSTVSIITDIKQNVLLVSNSAVKSSGDIYYVEKFVGSDAINITADQLEKIQVEIGSVNDTDTEITSGLSEGDQVLLRTVSASSTITSSSTTSSTNKPSTGNIMDMGGGMGGPPAGF